MKGRIPTFAALAAVILLGAAIGIDTLVPLAAAVETMTVPATAAEHLAEATRYDQEALDLQARADRHARLEDQYQRRLRSGGKQVALLRSLINHCENIAKAYRAAASEAHQMAKVHRDLAAAD